MCRRRSGINFYATDNNAMRPPCIYRMLFPGAVWRIKEEGRKRVFLTFDDGPIPEHTPWVLDVLDRYGAKATFFMVGENVDRYPEVYAEVVRRGHSVGNHTFQHMQGIGHSVASYVDNVDACGRKVDSLLFRPPHGLMRPLQLMKLRGKYKIIMYDVVARDYSSKLTGDEVFETVRRSVRDGSVIVFHDSVKAAPRLRESLPRVMEWLKEQGYEFGAIPMA